MCTYCITVVLYVHLRLLFFVKHIEYFFSVLSTRPSRRSYPTVTLQESKFLSPPLPLCVFRIFFEGKCFIADEGGGGGGRRKVVDPLFHPVFPRFFFGHLIPGEKKTFFISQVSCKSVGKHQATAENGFFFQKSFHSYSHIFEEAYCTVRSSTHTHKAFSL